MPASCFRPVIANSNILWTILDLRLPDFSGHIQQISFSTYYSFLSLLEIVSYIEFFTANHLKPTLNDAIWLQELIWETRK